MSDIPQHSDSAPHGAEEPETHSTPTENSVPIVEPVSPKSHDSKPQKKGKKSWWKKPIPLFTFTLIIINIFFLALSIWQAKIITEQAETAQQQLSVSRETMERQLRAYLYVTPSRIQQSKDSVLVVLDMLNCGQTPAYNVTPVHGEIFLFNNQSDVGLDSIISNFTVPNGSKLVASNSIVPPNEKGLVLNSIIVMDRQEWKAMAESKGAAYFLGVVHYKDIFGIQRHLKFRFMLFYHGGTVHLIPDKKGNEEY